MYKEYVLWAAPPHPHNSIAVLQHFALKPEPRKFLKALQSNAFKNFLVVLLIKNCCKSFVDFWVCGSVLQRSALPQTI
jgi:hypothetical protein